MEQFNKALSFILGLIVVAVFIVVASGKFNIKGIFIPKANTASSITPSITPQPTSKPWFSFMQQQPTSTPTPKPTDKPIMIGNNTQNQTTQTNQQNPSYHTYSNATTPASIPNTGVPIVLFPLFSTSLLSGIFMRKAGKKE